MKKTLIALAVLAASGAAMAQSSVTLYGIADAFVGAKKTGTAVAVDGAGNVNANPALNTNLIIRTQRQSVVDSSGLNGSRWGLKGVEDLGGGMKAVFVLESGFNIDSGVGANGTGLFSRQAFVGLDSSSFGAVSLGRQYGAYDSVRSNFLSAQGNSPSFDATNGTQFTQANLTALDTYAGAVAPTGAQAAAAAAALNVNGVASNRIGAWAGYQARIDNSIRYATPNISGFQAAVVYGFGENKNAPATATTLANPGNATKNASVSLTYANGPIAVAIVHQDDQYAAGATASGAAVDFHVKNTAIGGNYDFGVAKAFLAYNQAKYTGFSKQNEWAFGVRAPLGATTLVAQYAHSKGDDLGKNTSLGLSAEYGLSKRTTAYVGFNQTKIELLNNNKNDVFGLGVRHTF